MKQINVISLSHSGSTLYHDFKLQADGLFLFSSIDTRTVLEAIDELTDWYTLGLSLGLHTSTLDTIKEECSNVIIRCKAKVIENWLKCMDNVTEQPSWISLVNAISGKLIKDYTLAEKIRNMQVPSLTVKTD